MSEDLRQPDTRELVDSITSDETTPGPWTAMAGAGSTALVLGGDYTSEGEPDLICEISSENPMADARLIASVHDLREERDSLKAALAEAKERIAQLEDELAYYAQEDSE